MVPVDWEIESELSEKIPLVFVLPYVFLEAAPSKCPCTKAPTISWPEALTNVTDTVAEPLFTVVLIPEMCIG